jgi:hypothetical protein
VQKRTSERIRYSFFWPRLQKDVVDFSNQCKPRLQRSHLRATAYVPISYIERSGMPGAHMTYVIGPIDPPSIQGHNHLLCVIDACTSWPSVFLLKNSTAKAVCDCLCKSLAHLGRASVSSCAKAHNLVSKLTQEILTTLGCTPRFSMPGHQTVSGRLSALTLILNVFSIM